MNCTMKRSDKVYNAYDSLTLCAIDAESVNALASCYIRIYIMTSHSCSIPNIVAHNRPVKSQWLWQMHFCFLPIFSLHTISNLPYILCCISFRYDAKKRKEETLLPTYYYPMYEKSVQVYSINKPINSTFMTGFSCPSSKHW